jgi:hypothetical protein
MFIYSSSESKLQGKPRINDGVHTCDTSRCRKEEHLICDVFRGRKPLQGVSVLHYRQSFFRESTTPILCICCQHPLSDESIRPAVSKTPGGTELTWISGAVMIALIDRICQLEAKYRTSGVGCLDMT